MITGISSLDWYLERIRDEDEFFGWWIGEDDEVRVLWYDANAADPNRPYVMEVFPRRITHKDHQVNGALWTREQLVRWSRTTPADAQLADMLDRVREHLDRTRPSF